MRTVKWRNVNFVCCLDRRWHLSCRSARICSNILDPAPPQPGAAQHCLGHEVIGRKKKNVQKLGGTVSVTFVFVFLKKRSQ